MRQDEYARYFNRIAMRKASALESLRKLFIYLNGYDPEFVGPRLPSANTAHNSQTPNYKNATS